MTDQYSLAFVQALKNNDRSALSLFPKSDLHNHALLGSRRSKLESYLGKKLPAPGVMNSIAAMDQYLFTNLAPHLIDEKGFRYGIGACLSQAQEDGVSLLQMSIDSGFLSAFTGGVSGLVEMISELHQKIAPQMQLVPQLGLNRGTAVKLLTRQVEEAIATGFFKSIDLYGDELAQPPEVFQHIYRMASGAGWILAAHAGEFGDALSVRHCVEVLELQIVQHGIAAADSPEIMPWLRNQGIVLNICPGSNIKLGRARDYASHPMRALFDQGVKVTLNTDDLMIFDQSISDEYYNLHQAGLFSAEELDIIRLQGLEAVKFI